VGQGVNTLAPLEKLKLRKIVPVWAWVGLLELSPDF